MNKLLKKGLVSLLLVIIVLLFGITNVFAANVNVSKEGSDIEVFDVDLDTTYVGDLKDQISDRFNIDFSKIRLFYLNNPLDDYSLTLSECNILDNSTLQLVESNLLTLGVRGEGWISYGGENEDLDYENSIYIYEIINIPGTYKIGATTDETHDFVKWEKDGEDYSTNSEITITLGDEDIELVAVFETNQKEEYNLEANTCSILFTSIAGEEFQFSCSETTSITDEDLQYIVDLFDSDEVSFESLKEQLNQIIEYGKIAAQKNNGELLKIYEMYLYNNGADIHQVEGGFKIKIKYSSDMDGYDSYKLVYIDNDGNTEKAIELTKNGEYLEGTIPHLSMYALIGLKNDINNDIVNPKTGDNIVLYISIFGLSLIGIIIIKKLRY